MRLLIVLLILSISESSIGQSKHEVIDQKSKSVPDSLETYNEISNYLTKNLNTEIEKLRAIYSWICQNVKYDLDQLKNMKSYSSTEEIIDDVLKEKKGVCMHYSELFLAMCLSEGLKCYTISGYTKDYKDSIVNLPHSWNAVKLDTNYFLVDVTWSAGYTINNRYFHEFRDECFLVSPEIFLKDHMPFDPIWQLVSNPLRYEEFKNGDFKRLENKSDFSFKDSISRHENLSELMKLEESLVRMEKNGDPNRLIKKQKEQKNKRVNIEIFNIGINSGIESYNLGIESYNLYISHKNKRFRKPKISDSAIKELIDKAELRIKKADKIFKELAKEENDFDHYINDISEKMPEFISDLNREKEFVKKYLKTWKPFRFFIWMI